MFLQRKQAREVPFPMHEGRVARSPAGQQGQTARWCRVRAAARWWPQLPKPRSSLLFSIINRKAVRLLLELVEWVWRELQQTLPKELLSRPAELLGSRPEEESSRSTARHSTSCGALGTAGAGVVPPKGCSVPTLLHE